LRRSGKPIDYVKIIRRAIDLGYNSVMVDGSRLSLADNIAATRSVVEIADAAGIPIEAELGAIMSVSPKVWNYWIISRNSLTCRRFFFILSGSIP